MPCTNVRKTVEVYLALFSVIIVILTLLDEDFHSYQEAGLSFQYSSRTGHTKSVVGNSVACVVCVPIGHQPQISCFVCE